MLYGRSLDLPMKRERIAPDFIFRTSLYAIMLLLTVCPFPGGHTFCYLLSLLTRDPFGFEVIDAFFSFGELFGPVFGCGVFGWMFDPLLVVFDVVEETAKG